jgi:hypothetical protein
MNKKPAILIALMFLQSVVFAIDYPAWFLYPRLYPKFIAGFSYKGNPPEMDAEVMCCVYMHCEVEGYIETISNNNLNFLKNTQYHYVYPVEDLNRIEGKLFRQDRFILSVLTNDYVEAFSTARDVPFIKKNISPDSIPRPSWISKTTWEDDGYYYGVGMYTSRDNPSESWKTSEEQAVYAILTSISMKFFSFTLLGQDDVLNIQEFTNYTRTDIRFRISYIQTQERYPDLEKEQNYTLVRIKKSNVIPLSFDLK